MTKQEMWDLINKENAIKEENEANIVAAEKKIEELQKKIDTAMRKKDSASAIKFSDQLEAEQRRLDIYRNIVHSYKYGADISKDDFMRCFSEEVSTPYYKRAEELKAELSEKREAYIADMKKAYIELVDLSSKEREFWDINAKANLDINIPTSYPRNEFRDLFVENSPYFFAD